MKSQYSKAFVSLTSLESLVKPLNDFSRYQYTKIGMWWKFQDVSFTGVAVDGVKCITYGEWRRQTKNEQYDKIRRNITIGIAITGAVSAGYASARSDGDVVGDVFATTTGGLFGACVGMAAEVFIPATVVLGSAGYVFKIVRNRKNAIQRQQKRQEKENRKIEHAERYAEFFKQRVKHMMAADKLEKEDWTIQYPYNQSLEDYIESKERFYH
jgi:hypothetical protein